MKLTLTITADASALSAILAMLDDNDAPVVAANVIANPETYIAPMPVFPSAAPVMPEVSAAAPTIPGEPEFDSTGLAWDDRIHSKQKGQTNDGKWRKQRGVDDAYYNAVEAELRARYGHAAPAAQPVPVMPMPVAPVMPEGNVAPVFIPMPMPSVAPVVMEHGAVAVANVASEPVPMPIPVPMPAPVAAPQPQPIPVAAAEPVTFHTVMTHVGAAMGAGNMTPDYLVGLVAEINQQCGLAMASFTDMAAFPNAIEYCWAAFARDGKL